MTYCSREDNQKYKDHFQPGIYVCSCCDNELFNSKSKYLHSTPWPAFTQPVRNDCLKKEVETIPQTSSDKPALKLFCGKCNNILGHEFLGDGLTEGTSRF